MVEVTRRRLDRRLEKDVFTFTSGACGNSLGTSETSTDDGRRSWDPGEECGWLHSHTPVVGEFGEGSKQSIAMNANGVLCSRHGRPVMYS